MNNCKDARQCSVSQGKKNWKLCQFCVKIVFVQVQRQMDNQFSETLLLSERLKFYEQIRAVCSNDVEE
jgi:hypothetical protein